MISENEDQRWFELLCDLEDELSVAINSLGGISSNGIHDNFRFYSASYINCAAEGYIMLRRMGRLDSARLLVRPAIEALFRILAVRKDQSLLYRIAVKERNEHRKWVFPAAKRVGGSTNYEAEDEAAWAQFVSDYKCQFPKHVLLDQELSIYRAAEAAGVERYYDTHYRLYSKFAHAALAAMMGSFDEFRREDNRTMALCVMAAIEDLIAMNATVQHIDALRVRLAALLGRPSTENEGHL